MEKVRKKKRKKSTINIISDKVKRATDNAFKTRSNILIWVLIGIMLIGSISRVAFIMITKGEEYRKIASENQLYDVTIEGTRGTIYDNKMNPLAVSTSAWILCANPFEIQKLFKPMEELNPNHYEEYLNYLSKNISKILSLDESEVYEKLSDGSKKYVRIKKKVNPSEKIALDDFLKQEYNFKYMKKNERFFGLINRVDERKGTARSAGFFSYESDNLREYAQSNFASTVIGVVNSDGKGETGIEKYYNKYLEGTKGRIVTAKDSRGRVLDSSYETIFDASEGNGIVLTIDPNIQSYLENALEKALKEIRPDGVYGIVMDVKTGAVLAVSDKPDFDLNNAHTLSKDVDMSFIKKFPVGSKEYNEAYSEKLYEQWSSFCISQTYEPGSTFKIFTASAALEEGVVTLATTHNCTSGIKILDTPYHCANNRAHGFQDLTKGLMNSCNTFFITVGQKLGVEKFSKYFEAFGFTEKTGIDISGEGTPIYHSKEKMSVVNLASTSFGQSFEISPLQLITAACAIANGGNLMQPYLVSKIVDKDGNVLKETKPTVKRRVISEETSKKVISMMEAVVNDKSATGTKAYIEGYRVCGKTATAQKLSVKNGGYVASFLSFAPANDPQIAVLVGVDNAPGAYRGGGTLAGPIAKEVLEPSLKYLNIEPHYTAQELKNISTFAPKLVGLSLSEAKQRAVNAGLSAEIVGKGTKIVSQMPKAGEVLPSKGTIVLYTD